MRRDDVQLHVSTHTHTHTERERSFGPLAPSSEATQGLRGTHREMRGMDKGQMGRLLHAVAVVFFGLPGPAQPSNKYKEIGRDIFCRKLTGRERIRIF